MNKTVLTIVLAFSFVLSLKAQMADQRVGELMNDENWFGLIEEYPNLKDSLQSRALGLMAETMIYRYTNRKAQAVECIDTLLTKYQSDLGANIFNFIILRTQLLADLGMYATAADFLRDAIDQFKALGANGLESMEQYWKSINSLRKYSPTNLSRPDKDTHVAFTLKEMKPKHIEPWMKKKRSPKDKGFLITVPVRIHGDTVPFVFDTGADRTFVSEKFAKEKRLPFVGDTIKLNATLDGLRVYIDSLEIGDITIRNIIAYVGTEANNKGLDIVGIDAVLGLDIMAEIGETQINMVDSTLTFPIKTTPLPSTGVNLLNRSYVKAQSGKESLYMIFDTGNGNSNSCLLFAPYYNAHATEVNASAITDTISSVAYGKAGADVLKIIKDFTLSINDHSFKLDEAIIDDKGAIWGDWHGKLLSGNIGMAVVMQSRKVTLNYKDMFVKFD